MSRSVVVIGAGPAGLAAAIQASSRGCRVTVLDEARLPGGQIYRQADKALSGTDYAEATELRRKNQLLERFAGAAHGLRYRPGCAVYAVFPNREVHFLDGAQTEVVQPDAIILATGVREIAIPFPGWTLPGVMYAGGAQSILKSQRVLPGKRAVIAGCGPLPVVVAAQLLRAGGEVAALASLRTPAAMLADLPAAWHGRSILAEGARYAWTVLRAGVSRLTGHVPVRAIGTQSLEAVVLARADSEGRILPDTEREIACDLLAVNYGFAANSELAAMAGASMRRNPVSGWVPVADAFGRTSTAGVFVAGDGAGLRGALVAECEGTIVGAAAAQPDKVTEFPGDPVLAAALARRQRYEKFQSAVRRSLHVPPGLWSIAAGETTLCRCENVSVSEVLDVLKEGHRSLNAVKRNVRAGMGWCGGRNCLHAVSALAELHTNAAPVEMMTPRPMARPVPFAALAHQRRADTP